ncbi:MAG: serine/threonine protein kinase [Streptosporangiaceae bacterium]
MPVKPLEPGDPERLGRFELLGRLGEGGQGIVYLGRGTGPGEERVAVKVLRSSVDAMVLERLARELDAVHQVQPFVTAGVIEASAEGDRRYIVSEFVDGPSLQDRVRDRGPLPEHDLQRLAVGTVTALTAIHGAGVVHRDFKPANVLLGPDGPRVVDFGIARLIDASTITSGLIGTPSFIAPEQLGGARPTSAVDIFAWAVTMIFAATGRLAFGGDSVMAVMMRIINDVPDLTGVPDSLRPVIIECLDKDPARRPKARDIMLRLVDPSAPYPQQTLATPAGPGFPVDSVPPGHGAGQAAPAAFDPRTGPVPELAGPTPSGYTPTGYTPTGYTPTGYTPPGFAPPGSPPASRRSRRGLAVAAGGAAAVVVLAVVGVLLFAKGSPPASPSGTSSSSPPASAGSTPPASSAPASSAPASSLPAGQAGGSTIPAAFAGTWKGTATLAAIGPPGISFKNAITFTMAAGGTTAAENESGGCVNTLTLTSTTATVLTFSETQAGGCVAVTVTFTRQGAGLAYRWTNNVEQETATLRKS